MLKRKRHLKNLMLCTCTFFLFSGNSAYAAPEMGLSRERFNEQPLLNFHVDNELLENEAGIRFYSYSNYREAIHGATVRVYDGVDITLISPLQTINMGRIDNFSPFLWDGILADGSRVKKGQSYRFVLEVQDAAGNLDRTIPFEVTFKAEDLKGAKTDKEIGLPAFGKDRAAQRSIMPTGDVWILRGTGIEPGDSVMVNGEKIFSDEKGNFLLTEFHAAAPVFDIKVTDKTGAVIYERVIKHEAQAAEIKENTLFGIKNTDFFAMGLVDITMGKNSVSGHIEVAGDDDTYDEKVYLHGRSAFFLKGKIQGKYLLTAQLDTEEVRLKDIFKKLDERQTKDFIRYIDPNAYYPIYGDDSTMQSYAESQGKFFLKLEWDKSEVLWGNYDLSIGDANDLANYRRTLYGLYAGYESLDTTKYGFSKTKALGFTSSSNTLGQRDELRATGGTLYYLRHNGIVPGSEQIAIEVRDEYSSLVIGRTYLKENEDYTIDYFSGRIHLSKPDYSYVDTGLLISSSSNLANYTYVVVDYEYDLNEASPFGNNPTKGIQVSQWIGDHWKIGATYVADEQDKNKYTLFGGDIEYRPRKNSFIRYEQVTTDKSSSNDYISLDGGFTWRLIDKGTADYTPKSDGYQIRTEINFGDFINMKHQIILSSYYKFREKGYSALGQDVGSDTTEQGVAVEVRHANQKDRFLFNQSHLENEDDRKLDSVVANWNRKWDEKWETTLETRWVEDKNTRVSEEEWLAALKVKRHINPKLDVALTQQLSLWKSEGSERYDRTTLSLDYRPTPKLEIGLEGFTSPQGDGGFIRGSYELFGNTKLIGRQGIDYDRLEGRTQVSGVGVEHTVSNTLKAYTERQNKSTRRETSLDQIYGIQYQPKVGRTIDVNYTQSVVNNIDYSTAIGKRDIISVGYQFKNERYNWTGRLENRKDRGGSELTQNISKQKLDFKPNREWSFFTSHDYGKTEGVSAEKAYYNEFNFGGAYRPVNHNRLNVLFKYTRLDNRDPDIQSDIDNTFEKSEVYALEAIYKLSPKWSLGGKWAHKRGTLSLQDDPSYSFQSRTTFWGARVNYTLLKKWEVFTEYRVLEVSTASDKKAGFLVGAYRFIQSWRRLQLHRIHR